MATEAQREYQRLYYLENRDRILARVRARVDAMTPEQKAREKAVALARSSDHYQAIQSQRRRCRIYGLTIEELVELEKITNCQICDSDSPGPKKFARFAIDHCHRTNRVRGILCTGCNQGLGRFIDSPALLRAAADYLERTA